MKLLRHTGLAQPYQNESGEWQLPVLFKISWADEPDYEDISSVVQWADKAEWLGMDYLALRKAIIAEGLAYADANIEERAVLASFLLATPAELLQDMPISEIAKLGRAYHQSSKKARQDRWDLACSIAFNDAPQIVYTILGFAISSAFENMAYRYTEFGVKGTIEDYDPIRQTEPTIGIIDYLLSRANFAGIGLSSQPGTTASGQTYAQLAQQLADLLI